jgi:hypothetical protein
MRGSYIRGTYPSFGAVLARNYPMADGLTEQHGIRAVQLMEVNAVDRPAYTSHRTGEDHGRRAEPRTMLYMRRRALLLSEIRIRSVIRDAADLGPVGPF